MLDVNLFLLIWKWIIFRSWLWDFYTRVIFKIYISSSYLYLTNLFIRARVYPVIPEQLVYSIILSVDITAKWRFVVLKRAVFCLLRGRTVRFRHCLADSRATYWLSVRVSTHTHTCVARLSSRPHVLVMHARKHDVYDTITFSMHPTIDNWLYAR